MHERDDTVALLDAELRDRRQPSYNCLEKDGIGLGIPGGRHLAKLEFVKSVRMFVKVLVWLCLMRVV